MSVDFDLDADLIGNADDDILTPLAVPSYDDLANGGSNSRDQVEFEFEVEDQKVDQLRVTIATKHAVVYQETLPETMRTVGTHKWKWDGYSNAGTLDTKVLKDSSLFLKLEGERKGARRTATISFDNEAAEQDWIDVLINRHLRTVDVEVRLEIQDGGQNGVGEMPPDEVRNSAVYKSLPPSDPRRTRHTRVRSFADLKRLLMSGLARYWSRQVAMGSAIYTVKLNPVSATDLAMDDISVVYNTNSEWLRSSNPGKVRGFWSLFGNFVPERVAYNVGWLEYSNGWGYELPVNADREFGETGAHEIGHEILSAYGGDAYSYSHRGSSTVVTQTTKTVSEGGVSYPSTGEIDLMKYHNGARPRNYYTRVYASEQDVRSLLFLSRVEFDD